MDISVLTKFVKLPKNSIIVVCFVSAILLFAPKEILDKLSLFQFKTQYNMWLGITFLFSSGLCLAFIIQFISNSIKAYRIEKKNKVEEERLKLNEQLENKKKEENERKLQQELGQKLIADFHKILNNLDKHEMAILREFLIQEKNTIEISLEDPVASGLISKRVICLVSKQGYSTTITGKVAYFSIQKEAYDFVTSFDYKTIGNVPRPKWIERLATKDAFDKQRDDLAKMIQNISKI